MYGSGKVETLVGEALRERRDEIFLVSKVMPSNASYEGTLRACEQSLKRLRTDHLDCYLLHWRGNARLEETFRAFERLEKDGKIRSFGVSNFDVSDLEDAVRIAGEGRIACNQVEYHLKDRGIERAVIPWCVRHRISLVGYSPLGQGRFPKNRVVEEIARAHEVTPHAVVLRFLVRLEGTFTIPKAGRLDHALANARAGDVELTRSEISAIERAFPA